MPMTRSPASLAHASTATLSSLDKRIPGDLASLPIALHKLLVLRPSRAEFGPPCAMAHHSIAYLPVACLVALMACAEDPPATTTTTAASETTAAPETSTNEGDTAVSETDTGETGDQACTTDTPLALAECVDRDRYLADLTFIAAPREPGSAHWKAVQDLCVERFTAAGFETELHTYSTGVNVIGRKLGTDLPDEQILVAAHYDHIPGCAGADDNATGTAAVLELSRVLGQRDYPRTLVVACWDEEEDGLIGAEAYVALAQTSGDQILFNYNFEMIGYFDDAPDSQTVPAGFELLFAEQVEALTANQFRGDFVAVVVDETGLPHVEPFMAYAETFGLAAVLLPVPNDLKNSPLLSDLRRSDHAAFWEVDIPAVMLTDTSEFRYDNYHCQTGEDVVELLDPDFASKIVASTVGSAAESLGL
jgi:hypothetical protein